MLTARRRLRERGQEALARDWESRLERMPARMDKEAINAVLLVAILSVLQATLTLPGMAGIALTIGMAIDANVLINERIREELRLGKSARAAIEAGYQRALPAILDTNTNSLLAGAILFQFGTGPVRGFAVTLCIGVVTSVFTAVVGTRVVYDYLLTYRRLQTVSV